jgi:hypothetical protein
VSRLPVIQQMPDRACDENPLAGFTADPATR